MTICVVVWVYGNNGRERRPMKNFLTLKQPCYGIMYMSNCMCMRVCVRMVCV